MAFVPIMAGISLAMTAAAGAVTAMGAIQQGAAKQQMANYQAAVARINEQHARDVGEAEAEKSGMRTKAAIGEMMAIQGASNLDVNTGSGLAVRKSQLALGYQDEGTIRNNAAWRAFSESTQADLYTAAGREARIAGDISATGSILGTAASVSGKWAQAGSMGMFGGGADPGVALYNSGSALY